ncbi:MAG: hypothetical protein R3F43_00190 [bacterium]
MGGGPRLLLFTLPDGREYEAFLNLVGVGCFVGGCEVNERWTTPPGASVTSRDRDGRTYVDDLMVIDGQGLFRFSTVELYEPVNLELRTELGEIYRFRAGTLVSFRDAAGREQVWGGGAAATLEDLVELTRDAAGRVTQIRDPARGDQVHYRYDDRGDLVEVRFEGGAFDGEIQRYTYDDQHRMTGYEAPGARLVQVEHDALGRVVRRVDGTGAVVEYVYEDGARTVIHPSGAAFRYEHDAAGRVTRVVDPLGGETRFAYDEAGNEVQRIDAEGRVTARAYDAAGHLVRQERAGVVQTAAFDDAGRLVGFAREEGVGFALVHGADGVEVRDPAGHLLSALRYDENGDLVAEVDGAGRGVTFAYDDGGRNTLIQQADGRRFTTAWDGDTATVTDEATGRQHVTTYDPAGFLRGVTLPGGEAVRYAYDVRGYPRRIEGPGGETRLLSDGEGRFAGLSLDDERLTTIQRDADGNPVAVRDAQGRATRYVYDVAGRVTEVHTPEGGVERRDYDRSGKIIARHLPTGEVVGYAWDDGGRLAEIRQGELTSRLTYDGAGRLASITDALGRRFASTYDEFGNIAVAERPGMDPTRYRYESTFFRLQDGPHPLAGYTTPAGAEWAFERDAMLRLAAVVDPTGGRTVYRRDAVGRLVGVERPAGGHGS